MAGKGSKLRSEGTRKKFLLWFCHLDDNSISETECARTMSRVAFGEYAIAVNTDMSARKGSGCA